MTKNVIRSKVKEVNSTPSVVNSVSTGENHKDCIQQQQQPTETQRSKQTNFVDDDPNECRSPLKQLYTIPSDSNSMLFTTTHPSQYAPTLTMDTARTKQSTKLNDHSELVINDNMQTRTIDHVLPPNNAQGHSMSTSNYGTPADDKTNPPLQQQSIDTTVHQHLDYITLSNSNHADSRKRRRTSESPSIQQMDTKVGILPGNKTNITQHHQSSTGMTNTNLTPTSQHYYTPPIIMSPNPNDILPYGGFHTSQTDTASPTTTTNTQSRMKSNLSAFDSLPSKASNTPSSAEKVNAPIKEPTMTTPPARYATINHNPLQGTKMESVPQYDWWWSTYYQHYYRLMAQQYPPHIPPPPPPNPWTLPTISTLISQYSSSSPPPPPPPTSRKPNELSPSHDDPYWHYNYNYYHHHPPALPLSSSSPAQPPPLSPQKRKIDVLEQKPPEEHPSTMKDDKLC